VFATNDQAVFESHNVPSGLMAYRGVGDPFHVRFDMPNGSGAQVEQRGGHALVTQGDWQGVLIGNATHAGHGFDVRVDGENPMFFMAIPPDGIESQTRLDIAEGIATHKVFAEMSLMARNGTIAEDLTYFHEPDAFSLDVTNVTEDAITLDVAGEGEGQAIVLTVDRETLTVPMADLNVTMDGVVMTECATFDEMTQSAALGGCFHVVANETTLRVSVMPEHFSDHTIVIGTLPAPPLEDETSAAPASEEDDSAIAPGGDETPASESDPTPAAETPEAEKGTPGAGAFVLIATIAAVALIGRRRKG